MSLASPTDQIFGAEREVFLFRTQNIQFPCRLNVQRSLQPSLGPVEIMSLCLHYQVAVNYNKVMDEKGMVNC